jgi:hypothetical protein
VSYMAGAGPRMFGDLSPRIRPAKMYGGRYLAAEIRYALESISKLRHGLDLDGKRRESLQRKFRELYKALSASEQWSENSLSSPLVGRGGILILGYPFLPSVKNPGSVRTGFEAEPRWTQKSDRQDHA